MDWRETYNCIIRQNLCFTRDLGNGKYKGYFYTGIKEWKELEAGRERLYVMCEMLPIEQVTEFSFWKISRTDLINAIKNKTIELL